MSFTLNQNPSHKDTRAAVPPAKMVHSWVLEGPTERFKEMRERQRERDQTRTTERAFFFFFFNFFPNTKEKSRRNLDLEHRPTPTLRIAQSTKTGIKELGLSLCFSLRDEWQN
jgi:hypothetical protein